MFRTILRDGWQGGPRMVARVGGRWAIEELVRIALPACRAAAESRRRRGPGRPPVIPEWVIMVLIVVAVANRRRSKSAHYRFLAARREQLLEWIGTDRFAAQHRRLRVGHRERRESGTDASHRRAVSGNAVLRQSPDVAATASRSCDRNSHGWQLTSVVLNVLPHFHSLLRSLSCPIRRRWNRSNSRN